MDEKATVYVMEEVDWVGEGDRGPARLLRKRVFRGRFGTTAAMIWNTYMVLPAILLMQGAYRQFSERDDRTL